MVLYGVTYLGELSGVRVPVNYKQPARRNFGDWEGGPRFLDIFDERYIGE
uniref:Uncharacterized protein n=1 Tax=Arundo donax TaxID=35708 RepID=A0A0A8ZBZ7_ARUDO